MAFQAQVHLLVIPLILLLLIAFAQEQDEGMNFSGPQEQDESMIFSGAPAPSPRSSISLKTLLFIIGGLLAGGVALTFTLRSKCVISILNGENNSTTDTPPSPTDTSAAKSDDESQLSSGSPPCMIPDARVTTPTSISPQCPHCGEEGLSFGHFEFCNACRSGRAMFSFSGYSLH